MSGEVGEPTVFKKYATEYDPLKIGSIDGTDTQPHDRAIVRALNSVYTPDPRVRGDVHRTLFVGRLNPRTTEDTILSEFSKYGQIVQCRIVRDIVTGKSKQYGFVEFQSNGGADRALRVHGEALEGARLVVERVAARRLAGWRPRRLGGGLGGRKEGGQLRFGGRDRPFRPPIRLTRREPH